MTDGAKAVVETAGKVAAGVEAAKTEAQEMIKDGVVTTAKIVAGQLDKLQDKATTAASPPPLPASRRPSRLVARSRRRSSSSRPSCRRPIS